MPDRTPKGFPYPLSDDALADYPAVGRDLAERVDAIVQLPAGGAIADVPVWNGSAWIPTAGIATDITPPVDTVPPTVSGVVKVGSLVSRVPGTWDGMPVPTISWQWALDGTVEQEGGDDYLIPSDATGKTLRIIENATSAFGSSSASSDYVVAPAYTPPADGSYVLAASAVSDSGEANGWDDGNVWKSPLAPAIVALDAAANGYRLECRAYATAANGNGKYPIVRLKSGAGWYSENLHLALGTPMDTCPWKEAPMTAATIQLGFDLCRQQGGVGYPVTLSNPAIEWRYVAV